MKLITFLTFSIYLFANHLLVAQNSLSGKVIDLQGNPIIGANLFVPDLKIGTSTDTDGRYIIQELPARKMLLQVSYIGYNTTAREIDVQGATIANFTLQEAHLEMKEVVVTGLSVSQEKRRSPVSIDVLKKDFLLRANGTNLVDGLTRVAGVSAIATGPGISKPIIRGLGANRVLVVQDGIRQEGQQWGDEHGLEIDGYSVARVEIFRGPASLMYGSDGLGGVIHIESPHPVIKGTVEGKLHTAYQTNNQQREFSGFVATNANGWSGYLLGTYRKAEDFKNAYDGEVFNSGFEERSGTGMLGINRKWGYSHLHFSTFFQQPQLPEGERDSNGYFLTDAAPYQKIYHHKIAWNNDVIFENSSLKTVIGFQQNQRKEFEEPAQVGLFFDMKTLTYDVKYFIGEKNNWEYTFGISGMAQNSQNKGAEFLVPAYSLHDEGAFGYLRHAAKKWEVSAGFRFDHRNFSVEKLIEDNETRFEAATLNYGNISGSIGLSWLPFEKLAVKINLARGFRSPNIAELSSNGVHEGTFRYERGNTSLNAETNMEIDGGIELELQHISLALNPFFNHINNYIFLEKMASVSGGDSLSVVDGEAFPTFRYIQGKAQLFGGELTLDFHPHPHDWIHFKNTFSLVLAKQLDSPNEYLPFIPAPKYQMEIRADIPKESPSFRKIYFGTSFDYFFKQDRILAANDFETMTPAYGLWNANAGFDWTDKKGETIATFIFSALNILDKTYQNHLNRLKYAPLNPVTGRVGIYNMGRNFVLKLEIPLKGKIPKPQTD